MLGVFSESYCWASLKAVLLLDVFRDSPIAGRLSCQSYSWTYRLFCCRATGSYGLVSLEFKQIPSRPAMTITVLFEWVSAPPFPITLMNLLLFVPFLLKLKL